MATSRRISVEVASRALSEINARGLPADPLVYEVFYLYASGEKPELNRILDRAAATRGRLNRSDIEDIHRRFFGADLLSRMEDTRGTMGDEIERIVAAIEAAVERHGQHSRDFGYAGQQLGKRELDRDTLRHVVETLFTSAREMEVQNNHLGLDLQQSHEQIAHLRNDLKLVRTQQLTDALTGLPNRRQFDRLLGEAMAESASEQEPFCLVLFDIDHFKTFNDAYGHNTGDFVLKLVAQELRRGLKHKDVIARYGGEEFSVILPQTALRPATIAADNVRRAVAEKKVVKRSTGEELGHIRVSAGVAQFRIGETMQMLIDRADACLHEAKAMGRNCVVDEASWEAKAGTPMMRVG